MTRERGYITAALTAALVIAMTAVLWSGWRRTGGPQLNGPIASSNPSAFTPNDVRPGDVFTFGLIQINLRGSSPARIQDVRPLNVEGTALDYLGALIAAPRRKVPAVSDFSGFPPRARELDGALLPAKGALIRPTSRTAKGYGYELLLGYKYKDDEFAAVDSVAIDYSVSDEAYRVVVPSAMVLCPTFMSPRTCANKSSELFPE